MKKEKTGKRKTVRGTVLFTTVSVMALLIIFLTGALALASSANNRAHKSYASSQASYNARAAIDSFTQAMINDPGVAAAVHDLGGGSLQPELSIGNSAATVADWDNAKGWGTIGYYDAAGNFHPGQINVESINGGNRYGWDSTKGEWVSLTQFKITATARYGREEETITAYINTAINEESTLNIKGLQAVGSTVFKTNDKITGGFGLNIGEAPTECTFDNSFDLKTELAFVNGSLNWKAAAKYHGMLIKNGTSYEPSKLIILGDLLMTDTTPAIAFVDYDPSLLGDSFTQKDVPLIYIDGELKTTQATASVVKGNKAPFNVFAGSADLHQGSFDAADLYLMDANKTSYIGKANNSTLYKWTKNMTGASSFSSSGGNIYCNGNLEINKALIYGDVRVRGNCEIKSGETKIYGNLIVGGTLKTNGNLVKMVSGKVYAGSTDAADASTLKEGYESHHNIPHKNDILPGYKEVTWNNYPLELIEEVPVKQNESPYTYVIYGNGSNKIDVQWRQEPVYWMPDYSKYFDTPDYYYKADAEGNATDEIVTDEEVTYYIKIDDGSVVTKDDAFGEAENNEKTEFKMYYTEWNNPDVITDKAEYYYKIEADGSLTQITKDEDIAKIFETGKINPLSAYSNKDEIYPNAMTKQAIYGEWVTVKEGDTEVSRFVPAPSDTKLITTLPEARKALGLDSEGHVDTTNLDTTQILKSSHLWDFDNHCAVNDDNTVDITNCAATVERTDSFVITGHAGNNGDKTINIRPTQDIYVLLDDVTYGGNLDIVIHNEVKDATGAVTGHTPTVTFIINGAFDIMKGAIRSVSIKQNCTVKYTDDFGIYYYGLSGDEDSAIVNNALVGTKLSSIKAQNNLTLVGCVKAPYTTLHLEVPATYKVNYINENGEKIKMGGGIIGNALVKDAQVKNDFGLVYTRSGSNAGGSGSFYSAVGDQYQLMYYAAS